MFYIFKGTNKDTTRINEAIRAKEIRVVSDDGEQYGVLTLREALEKAQEAGMDLVEISPNADPPVCKIMDYGKFKYEKTKKDKENKKFSLNQDYINKKDNVEILTEKSIEYIKNIRNI